MQKFVRIVTLLVVLVGVPTFVLGQQSEQSRKALESAAGKGSAPAAYALGAAAESDGDLPRAIGWYQQAAERGYAAAQFKLGEFFENGTGVVADQTQALDWYRKAAAQNFDGANDRLERLAPPTASIPTATPEVGSAPVVLPPEPPPTPSAIQQAPQAPAMTPAPALATTAPASTVVVNGTTGIGSWDRLPEQTRNNISVAYLLVSTFLGWLLMRPVIMRWYRGGDWLVSGSGVRDVFYKSINARLQAEGLALSIGAMVGCFGGNLWFLVSRIGRLAARKSSGEDTETA